MRLCFRCIAFFACLVLAVINTLSAHAQQGDVLDATPVDRTYIGKYDCTTVDDGADCGSENWIMTVQKDGNRTLRAYLDSSAVFTQNNTVLRVNQDFRPIEAFTNLYRGAEVFGSLLFAVHDSTLSVTMNSPSGLLSDEISLPDKFVLLLYPNSAYGWLLGNYDQTKGGVQSENMCVLAPNGQGTSCVLMEQPLEYVGRETITVPAGTFDTEHYKIGRGDTWVTGPDRVVVKHEHPARNARAQLIEYRSEP